MKTQKPKPRPLESWITPEWMSIKHPNFERNCMLAIQALLLVLLVYLLVKIDKIEKRQGRHERKVGQQSSQEAFNIYARHLREQAIDQAHKENP